MMTLAHITNYEIGPLLTIFSLGVLVGIGLASALWIWRSQR